MITLTDADVAWVLQHISDEGRASSFRISNFFERKKEETNRSDFDPDSASMISDSYRNG